MLKDTTKASRAKAGGGATKSESFSPKKAEPVRHFPTPEEIALRAYEIWLGEGQPVGRDEAHWLRAEAELSARPGDNAVH